MVIEMVTATTQREDSVKMIEQALALMEAERVKLLDQRTQHDEQERRLAFDARLGSAEAGKLLVQLRHEKSKVQSQINSIDAANDEGQRRLVLARAREQEEQNGIKAEALRKVLGRFTAAGRELENALMALVRSSQEMRRALRDLHAGGIHNPRHEVIDGLGYRALATELRKTIWANHFRPLGHDDRRNFADLITSWGSAIEHAITAQLGERTDEVA
jgi:hypothetical protein